MEKALIKSSEKKPISKLNGIDMAVTREARTAIRKRKTITIASTRGNQKIEGTDAIFGLNVYKYPESEKIY